MDLCIHTIGVLGNYPRKYRGKVSFIVARALWAIECEDRDPNCTKDPPRIHETLYTVMHGTSTCVEARYQPYSPASTLNDTEPLAEASPCESGDSPGVFRHMSTY